MPTRNTSSLASHEAVSGVRRSSRKPTQTDFYHNNLSTEKHSPHRKGGPNAKKRPSKQSRHKNRKVRRRVQEEDRDYESENLELSEKARAFLLNHPDEAQKLKRMDERFRSIGNKSGFDLQAKEKWVRKVLEKKRASEALIETGSEDSDGEGSDDGDGEEEEEEEEEEEANANAQQQRWRQKEDDEDTEDAVEEESDAEEEVGGGAAIAAKYNHSDDDVSENAESEEEEEEEEEEEDDDENGFRRSTEFTEEVGRAALRTSSNAAPGAPQVPQRFAPAAAALPVASPTSLPNLPRDCAKLRVVKVSKTYVDGQIIVKYKVCVPPNERAIWFQSTEVRTLWPDALINFYEDKVAIAAPLRREVDV